MPTIKVNGVWTDITERKYKAMQKKAEAEAAQGKADRREAALAEQVKADEHSKMIADSDAKRFKAKQRKHAKLEQMRLDKAEADAQAEAERTAQRIAAVAAVSDTKHAQPVIVVTEPDYRPV